MHVLFVIDTWALIGGTERHAGVVVPDLIERGHEVTVLCRESRPEGLPPVPVIEDPALGHPSLAIAARRSITARLRAASPDVVFVSALRSVDVLELLIDLAPLVRYVHDHTLFCPGLNKLYMDGGRCGDPMGVVCLERFWLRDGCVCFNRKRQRKAFLDPLRELRARWREIDLTRHAACLLTNSRYMRSELLKVGFDPERTRVLHYFTLSNTEHQPKGGLPEGTRSFLDATDLPLIFTPARLTHPDKGVDYLLTTIGKTRHPVRAVVAGTGPAQPWLLRKTREEGMSDRVHFTGWLDSGAVESLYGLAELVVCPSVWDEPFGLIGLEAMAHAKPVVSFRVGGIPEWLRDGETGFLAESTDTDGMADAIDSLLDDPGLLRRFGERGREILHRFFSRERHMAGLEEALESAVG